MTGKEEIEGRHQAAGVRTVAKLSTMPGWEWVIPPEHEPELRRTLNRLGVERTTSALDRVMARVLSRARTQAPMASDLRAAAIRTFIDQAKAAGVTVSEDAVEDLLAIHGFAGLQMMERVVADYRTQGGEGAIRVPPINMDE